MDANTAGVEQALGFGFSFEDLRHREGLVGLDRLFLARLEEQDPGLHAALLAARAAPESLDAKAEGELLVALGPHLEAFLAELFGIEAEIAALASRTRALDPIHACKRLFVQRQAVKKYPDPAGLRRPRLARGTRSAARRSRSTERGFAHGVAAWERAGDAEALDVAAALRRLGDADPGRDTRRIPATRCSGCRTSSTSSIWCRSKRSSATASPCCGCPSTTGGSATDSA